MTLRSLFIYIGALLLNSTHSFSQISSDQYSFNYYSTAQGLSNNSVLCTVQDYLGYIWIGTKDGLNRFDGKYFKVYRNIAGDNSSIPNNYILKVYQDNDSVLWIGTRGGGLCRYNRETDSFTNFPYNSKDPQSLSHPEVLSIFEDVDGYLWIGTDGGGLNQLNKTTGLIRRFNKLAPSQGGLSSLKILSITDYDRDNLLLGTWDGGLNIFNKKTGKCQIIKAGAGKLNSNNIWLVQKEGENGYWIGHFEKGLQFLNRLTGQFTNIILPQRFSASVYSVVKYSSDKIWVGTSSGIYTTRIYFKNNNLGYDPMQLFNHFFSLHLNMSDDKSLWASNFDNGLMHVHLNNPQFKITEFSRSRFVHNISNLYVNSFEQLNNNQLILGTTHGAAKYIPQTDTLIYLEDTIANIPVSKRIVKLTKNSRNELFAGKSLFLAKFNEKTQRFEKFFKLPQNQNPYDRDGYYDLLFDNQWLWLATENGLYKLDQFSQELKSIIKQDQKHNGANIYQIRSLGSDSENIYAATLGGGLVVVNKKSNKLKIYQNNKDDPNSISSNHINQVFISSREQIWLATFNGLVYFDKTKGSFKHYGIKEGFQAEFLTGIAEDLKGNLWLTSQHGITKYNPETHKTENFYFYSQLTEKTFQVNSTFTDKNGRIYFGRRGGFISFHPDSIFLNSKPSSVLITGFKINNSEVKISPNSVLKKNIENTKKIVLRHNQNSFSFSYAVMDFSFPERNKYAYQLKDIDDNWVYTNASNVSYTNIPPGKYVFRVKAANQDGYWNEKGATIELVIRPAFWQTMAFKLTLIFLFVTVAYIWYRRRVNKIKRDKAYLQELVNAKTSELLQANKVLEDQFEELKLNKEELQTQRDALTDANQLLEEKTIEIETQNKELESHRENLEKLVFERTLELKIALEKAEQSDRLKTAFLANLSHEIRTPLNAIVGFSALINDEHLTPDKRTNYNKIIQSSTQSLLVLIDDLINLAKIETDQIDINPQYFSANELLNELFVMFSEDQERIVDLRLNAEVSKTEVLLYSDATRLQQILTNLITNALKFTEAGYVEIGFQVQNGSQLDFYVKDTGIGIEPNNFELIFERFQKLENNSKFYRGAGLGLAISKKLASLLGATLWLESEFGKGSTFYITFKDNFTLNNIS